MAELSRLPGPNADPWDWQLLGACRRADPDVFFHPDNERGPRRRNREAAAKAVCHRCPVMVECARHALSVREPYGVWGGLTEDDREEIYAAGRGVSSPPAASARVVAEPAEPPSVPAVAPAA
jgi:WhiB family transcriptional regulator, redox-sensing transcriptional regulator